MHENLQVTDPYKLTDGTNPSGVHIIMEGGEAPIHQITSKERRDIVVIPMQERGLDVQEIYAKTAVVEKFIETDDHE